MTTERPTIERGTVAPAPGLRELDGFTVFAFLWTAAALLYSVKGVLFTADHKGVLYSPLELIIGLTAFWVFARPSSVRRFLVLISLQFIAVLDGLPNVSVRSILVLFVTATILAAFGRSALAIRSFRVEGPQLFLASAPVLRIELLILYFFAVFHKLNADYFRPDVSCGAQFFLGTARVLPASAWAQNIGIYSSIIAEAAIPLLLISRRTRNWGVVVGVVFHYLLALEPNHSFEFFSSAMVAMLSLYAPPNLPTLVRSRWAVWTAGRWPRGLSRPSLRRPAYRWLAGAFAACLALVFVVMYSRPAWERRFGSTLTAVGYERWQRDWLAAYLAIPKIVWIVCGLVLIVLVVSTMRREAARLQPIPRPFALRYASLAILPLLMFFNGLTPYLGLKTEGSYSMFSNLRTEDGRINHLIVRETFPLAGYQDDLVAIVHSSDRKLQRFADHGFVLTYFEFHSYVSKHPGIAVTYRRHGVQRSITRVGDDPELSQPVSLIQRKLLAFKPVDTRPAVRCRH